jgi:hypothetical protein
MTEAEREALIERAASAWRDRAPDGRILTDPAWRDLSPEDRARAFERALRWRQLEAALDDDGLSSTARAVLARITPSE